MNDNLDTIFYNPDHTKTYNPSGKPTGVVMTDFDIMEAKQAIQTHIDKKVNEVLGELNKEIFFSSANPDGQLLKNIILNKRRTIKKLRSEL